MPAESDRARRFFGAVRSYKEGRGSGSPEVKRASRSMTHEQVRDMTRKPTKRSSRSKGRRSKGR
jgi:hypothetical protein